MVRSLVNTKRKTFLSMQKQSPKTEWPLKTCYVQRERLRKSYPSYSSFKVAMKAWLI